MSTFLVPSPLGRGVGRFSRLLSLHTLLQSTCTALKFGFINNFDLFWDHSHLFRPDGTHPNWWVNKMLTANLQHTVQSTSHAWLFIPFFPKHPPTQITVPPVSSPCQSHLSLTLAPESLPIQSIIIQADPDLSRTVSISNRVPVTVRCLPAKFNRNPKHRNINILTGP